MRLSSPSPSTDPTSLSPSASRLSAAEIDNETLQTQIVHLQSKISTLEDNLEEARSQLESEAEAWKARLEKARAGEREKSEVARGLKEEIATLQGQAKGAKGRLGEMEGALAEVRVALEGARSEIEGLRGEAAVSSGSFGTGLKRLLTDTRKRLHFVLLFRKLRRRSLRSQRVQRRWTSFGQRWLGSKR